MEKLKIYLDTNMIYGLFKRMLQEILGEREFKLTKKISIIHENLEYLEPYTSFFTLIEVIEELRGWALKKKKIFLTSDQISSLINFFKENFHVDILRSIWITEKTVRYVLSQMQWKDAIQLEIARVNDFFLITDDDDLKKIGKQFYDKIMNFQDLLNELKKMKSNSS